jgi:hypothetical protein
MFSKLVRSKPLKRYVRFHSTLHIENNFRYKPAFQLLIHSKLPLYKDPSFLPRRFIKISSIKDFITYQRSWFRRSSRHITHITNSAVVLGFALIVSICLFISKLTQRTESKDKSHPLFPGEVLEKYKVGRLLGTGSFGSVYEATVKVFPLFYKLKISSSTFPVGSMLGLYCSYYFPLSPENRRESGLKSYF